jgi:hypothetical protein
VTNDILERLPYLNTTEIKALAAYAANGAGMVKVYRVVREFLVADWEVDPWAEQLDGLRSWFRQWRNGREIKEFYRSLFETHGYSCEQVLLRYTE